MQKIVVLICCLVLAGCSKVEMSSDKNLVNPVASPTMEEISLLKPVIPKVELNKNQRKYLDESLPSQVREILEKAEKFEVLAEIRESNEFDGEGRTFEANRIAKITTETDKKRILEAFYFDSSIEVSPATCYEPHHSIRATLKDKTVDVEICFSCARFKVKSPFGSFEGTIVRENRKSEKVFEQIITTKSILINN